MTPTPETILKLIGNQPYNEVMVVDEQTTQDIVDAILDKHQACTQDYDKFAFLFDGGTVPQICKRIYDFCLQYIPYRVEKSKYQYTSKPKTILERGYSDCKCYALFIGGVLDGLRRAGRTDIDWNFRFASYKLLHRNPHHVFVVVHYEGRDIYVDPVFSQFNYRKPIMYAYDYAAETDPAAVGCPLYADCAGNLSHQGPRIGTTAQTGAAILKITGTVSPVLTEVPVVGWVLIGAGALTGFFLEVFGSRYSSSTGVRWLEQMFDYYVRSMGSVTSDNKVPGTTQDINAAQDWFGYVLGVPIYDKYRWHALRGENGDTGARLGISQAQMVQNYLNFPEVQKAGVTYDQALAASNIALGMEYRAGDAPGLWANMTAAPSVFAPTHAAAAANAAATANLYPVQTIFHKPIFWIAAAVAILLIIKKD